MSPYRCQWFQGQTFNRTMLELKSQNIFKGFSGITTFNRTMLELKLSNTSVLDPWAVLLIAPCWN